MASDKTQELYRLLLEKGYPTEFCREVAYKIYEYRLYCDPDDRLSLQDHQSENRGSGR